MMSSMFAPEKTVRGNLTRLMQALITLPPGRRLTVWFLAFFSPTAYLFLLLLAGGSEIPGLLKPVVGLLFFLIPVAALLVCESVVWWSNITVAWKIGWMLFTLLAMLLQFGILAVIIRAILVAAIGYVQ
ncbi:MAG: hypothetical protein L0Z50_40200 [Verrucomicrobiales bacterium]|nr:hypothetical protein [Verrucomicrobiales bacterium]